MALLSLHKAHLQTCMASAQVREDRARTCQAMEPTRVCLDLPAFLATDNLRVDITPPGECPAMDKLLPPHRALAVVAFHLKEVSKAGITPRATATWACPAVPVATVKSRTRLVDGVNNAEVPTTALEVLLDMAATSNVLRAFLSSTLDHSTLMCPFRFFSRSLLSKSVPFTCHVVFQLWILVFANRARFTALFNLGWQKFRGCTQCLS